MQSIVDRVKKYVDDPHLRQLVLTILEEHGDLFSKMPAAADHAPLVHRRLARARLEHVARGRPAGRPLRQVLLASSILP